MSIFKDLVSLGFLNYCTYEVEGEEKDIYIYILLYKYNIYNRLYNYYITFIQLYIIYLSDKYYINYIHLISPYINLLSIYSFSFLYLLDNVTI